MNRLTDHQISLVASSLLKKQSFDRDKNTAIVCYDLDLIEKRVSDLKSAFPRTALHAIAVKANPFVKILESIAALEVGAEVASLPELKLALHAGFSSNRIVFDSPCKTNSEIREALQTGCYLNADSIEELDRIAHIIENLHATLQSIIGVRINPQVGIGAIPTTSVAGAYSKFGVPLTEKRNDLVDRFRNYPWLNGIHMHIGSQGVNLEMLMSGAARLVEFVSELNELNTDETDKNRVSHIDIGGGLPVSYSDEMNGPSLKEYATQLELNHPTLFDGSMQLITEFGRYVHANAGWTISKVEYVKDFESVKTAMIHVGADMFLRKCYRPDDWHHDVLVIDESGKIRQGIDSKPYNIAGPLCFAGDIIAKEISLPCIQPGDYIVIKDTGAYTTSMWSRYNSRQMPEVLGYRSDGAELCMIRDRETIEDVISYWS